MTFHDIEQGTTAWKALRLGKPTASGFKNLVTLGGASRLVKQKKDGTIEHLPEDEWPEVPRSYRRYLLAERITGEARGGEGEDEGEGLGTEAVEHGKYFEPVAADALAFDMGLDLLPGGFFTSGCGRWGASPDRRIADGGLVEIKCCQAKEHLRIWESPEVPREYLPQVQGQMMVARAPYSLFAAYHPALPMKVFRVTPDLAYRRVLLEALDLFCTALDASEAAILKSINPKRKET
jgi:hypothetical protein